VKAVTYSRYSSDQQREASIEDQQRNCLRRAQLEGWIIGHQYVDRAVSGSDSRRPEYLKLLADATTRAFSVILVDDLSRLWRDSLESERVMRRLEFAGVRIIGVSDGYDSDSKSRKIHRGFKNLMNETFLDDLREKVHRGQEGQARKGRWNGGRPYGYKLKKITDPCRVDAHGEPERIGTLLEKEPNQERVVQMIFRLRADGVSCHAIAEELNKRGVPSPGATWDRKVRRCGGWLQTAVRGIVMNRRYTGRCRWNATQYLRDPDTGKDRKRARPESEWVTSFDESLRIVSDELFERANKPRRTRNSNQPVRTGGKPKYLLSGLLECAVCKANYVLANNCSYGCSGYLNGKACSNPVRVRRDDAEKIIIGPIKDELLSPDRIRRMGKEMQAQYAEWESVAANRAEALPEEQRQLDERIGRLRERLRSGDPDMTPDEVQAAIERAESKRSQLASTPAAGAQSKVIAFLPRAAELYRAQVAAGLGGDPGAVLKARTALRELIGEVKLQPGEDGSLWASYDFQPAVLLRGGTDGRGERI
jgi:site-specific DNA recombinase